MTPKPKTYDPPLHPVKAETAMRDLGQWPIQKFHMCIQPIALSMWKASTRGTGRARRRHPCCALCTERHKTGIQLCHPSLLLRL
jgi:hypothetical protein